MRRIPPLRLLLVVLVLFVLLALPVLFAPLVRAADPGQRLELRRGSTLLGVIPTSTEETAPEANSASEASEEGERSNWQLQATVGNVLKAVSFADPLHGFAAAELGAVYKTTNGGQTWTRVLNLGFPYYWYGVQAFSAQTAMIVGFQNQSGAGVARWTDNGGATWTNDLVIDPANWLLGLKFADALHGIAYGNLGYVYWTQNGGRNAGDWTKVATHPDLGWLAGNFTFRPDLNAYITGIHFCRSTDGGASWIAGSSADAVFDGGCSFPDLLHGWTGGGQISNPVSGWVHRTTDGGISWSPRLMQPTYPIRVVLFFDSNFGLAAGGNIYSSAGGIWSTTDSGNSWTLDLNTGAEMAAVDTQPVSADSTDVWCVGFLPNFNGVIYKKRMARHEPAGVGDFTPRMVPEGRAAPNPFRMRTMITLPGPNAAVFDLVGRRVCVLPPAGPGLYSWDGRNEAGREVPSGVYLIRSAQGDGRALSVLRIR